MSGTTGTISLNLGDVTNTDINNGASEQFVLTLKAVVENSAGNNAGSTLNNRGEITYNNISGVPQNQTTVDIPVHVGEPAVTIVKTANPGAAAGGGTITFTLVITNTASGSNAASAFDIALSDPLPGDFIAPFIVTNINVGSSGATASASFTGNVLTGSINQLDPSELVTITYTAVAQQ